MSDEINITNNNDEKNHENKCLCQSKGFRKFLVIALGTFVGVYCALCLFAALHRPPMMPPMGFRGYPMQGVQRECPCKTMHHHHFKYDNGDKKVVPHNDRTQAPFDSQRTETIE